MQNEHANLAGMELGIDAANEMRGCHVGYVPTDCPHCLRPREAGHHGCYCEPDDEPDDEPEVTITEVRRIEGFWVTSQLYEGIPMDQARELVADHLWWVRRKLMKATTDQRGIRWHIYTEHGESLDHTLEVGNA